MALKIKKPDLTALEKMADDDERNRHILRWLLDDDTRNDLFRQISGRQGEFRFPSRDAGPRDCDCKELEESRPEPATGYKQVRLVTRREDIEEILCDKTGKYSKRLYAELGGGSFMLALDPKAGGAHELQRAAYHACFKVPLPHMLELSHFACKAGAIMSLRAPDFDLASFAEQAALRFCQKLMGYALTDYPLLETAMRRGYRGLVYQVLGRHFVTDPTAIPAAKLEMGRLLARTAALIDAWANVPATNDMKGTDEDDKYDKDDRDVLKGTLDRDTPAGFVPVLRQLGELRNGLNGKQRAVIAAGAALGTVGNVQAAVCIAVKAFFKDDTLMKAAWELARKEKADVPTSEYDTWKRLIQEPLRKNPPIPFLPRLQVNEGIAVPDHGEILLALGGGTQGEAKCDDPLIWGFPESDRRGCAGQVLAWPLIVEIVRQVIRLPGLAERLDPEDGEPYGLTKRWGFACESYPLTHQRDRRIAQSSLNVAMRLKSPVKDNADRVREIIRAGAPRIEEALRDAQHVHFAWFELTESDTVLVLHTVYDGPFFPYIQHFAMRVGYLFDALFECIENPPPTPVDKFPNEFVAHIQRHDRAPAMGYFFSAYPNTEVALILRNESNGVSRP